MRTFISILLAVLFIAVLCSCRPSKSDMVTAITECVEKEIPMSWSGSILGGKNVKVTSIEIIEMGKYNRRGEYWPVKANVTGTCDAILFFESKTNSFDKTAEFRISKDDYGNIVANFSDMF